MGLENIKKVVVVGPECTGKSDLSQFLAQHFKTDWVPEYARNYLEHLTRPYQESDLLSIAHGQIRIEDEWARDADRLLICDTNLYVIKIWSQVRFGSVHPEILSIIDSRKYDLYLLTYIDIPWEEDPQREHPNQREHLYELYLEQMSKQTVPFVEIKGTREDRQRDAVRAIEGLFTSNQ